MCSIQPDLPTLRYLVQYLPILLRAATSRPTSRATESLPRHLYPSAVIHPIKNKDAFCRRGRMGAPQATCILHLPSVSFPVWVSFRLQRSHTVIQDDYKYLSSDDQQASQGTRQPSFPRRLGVADSTPQTWPSSLMLSSTHTTRQAHLPSLLLLVRSM
jgi:hypothetical protein